MAIHLSETGNSLGLKCLFCHELSIFKDVFLSEKNRSRYVSSDFESYRIRELVCLFSCLECRFSQSAFVYSRCAVDKRLLDCSFSSTEGILYERKTYELRN